MIDLSATVKSDGQGHAIQVPPKKGRLWPGGMGQVEEVGDPWEDFRRSLANVCQCQPSFFVLVR